MLEARLEWAQDVAAALMEYVDYPDVNVPTRTYTDPEEITAGDIEALAGLPEGYFQGKTNVVEFARLKAVQKPTDDRPGQGNKVVQFRPVSKS